MARAGRRGPPGRISARVFVILSALYLPIVFMLLGLIFRGVAFEFRFKASEQRRHWWDKAFIGGSAVAALSQGVILGAYINGIRVAESAMRVALSIGSRHFRYLPALACACLCASGWCVVDP